MIECVCTCCAELTQRLHALGELLAEVTGQRDAFLLQLEARQ